MRIFLISSKDVIVRDENGYRIFSSHKTRQAAIVRAKELNETEVSNDAAAAIRARSNGAGRE